MLHSIIQQMDVARIANVYKRCLGQLPRCHAHAPDKNRHLRALFD
jgi:hypothetical protein